MKLPRDLSGRELAGHLCVEWDYHFVHQQGSHIILQTSVPGHQRLPVPDHKILRLGTLNAILRQVAQHKNVSREDILASL